MHIEEYNTEHLTFKLRRFSKYEFLVFYDDEWLYYRLFETEKDVKEFLEKYYIVFKGKEKHINSKIIAAERMLCREAKDDLEWILG